MRAYVRTCVRACISVCSVCLYLCGCRMDVCAHTCYLSVNTISKLVCRVFMGSKYRKVKLIMKCFKSLSASKATSGATHTNMQWQNVK